MMRAFWRGFLRATLYGIALVLLTLALVEVLQFLLARPVVMAVVFALVVVGAYRWCYVQKGELR